MEFSDKKKENTKLLNPLRRILENDLPVFISASEVDVRFETRIIELNNSEIILKNPVDIDAIHAVMNSKDYLLQADLFRWKSNTLKSDGVNLIFSIDSAQAISLSRTDERKMFPPSSNNHCRMTNPIDNETILIKELIDLSDQGCSFKTNIGSKVFSKKPRLKDFELRLEGQDPLLRPSTVVHFNRIQNLDKQLYMQIGIKFDSP